MVSLSMPTTVTLPLWSLSDLTANQSNAVRCRSASISNTLSPSSAKATARLVAKVVLPAPPFCVTTAILIRHLTATERTVTVLHLSWYTQALCPQLSMCLVRGDRTMRESHRSNRIAPREPINLTEWTSRTDRGHKERLFTCGRPGRAISAKRLPVGCVIIDNWVEGLPG